jgi:hypothetical protein
MHNRWLVILGNELEESLMLVHPGTFVNFEVAAAEAHWARQAAYTMRDTLSRTMESRKNVLLELQSLFHGFMQTSLIHYPWPHVTYCVL